MTMHRNGRFWAMTKGLQYAVDNDTGTFGTVDADVGIRKNW